MSATTWMFKAGESALALGRYVPFVCQRSVIETVAARLFVQPLKDGAFDLLQGRWLRLEVADLKLAWNLTCESGRLRVAQRPECDACIRGNWRDFLLLASRQEDPDTLFFRRRLVIEGDTELGLGVKNLLDALDPDDLPPTVWRVLRGLGDVVQQAS